MNKLMITAAINGGITSRQKHPSVPYTPDEIAESAYQAWNAGACIAHIHARDIHGKPSYEKGIWGEIVAKVRERCDILLNLSTSSYNLPDEMPIETAWNHVEFRPEIASFNCGSVNHGSKPFVNAPQDYTQLAEALKSHQILPEVEVYHTGVISEANALLAAGLIPESTMYSLALGIHGGTPATLKNLLNLIDNLPENSTWSALAIGKHQLPINAHTLLLGGHVRTGLEDNVYYHRGELANGNAQLVERIVRLSRELGREIASPDDARTMLGLTKGQS
ncbi:beta-keto acid cleavage family enzyme [Photobacterium sp. R1]